MPSATGPVLRDFFGSRDYKSTFVMKGLSQSFGWSYEFYNENPVDDDFTDFWDNSKIDVVASV